MPGVLFDTDGSAYNTRRDTMRYMRLAPKIGIPDLYWHHGIPLAHPFQTTIGRALRTSGASTASLSTAP